MPNTADRRPVAFIGTHGAPWADGNEGLRRDLVDPVEGYKWLRERFRRPYRRVLLHMPNGWRQGEPMGGDQVPDEPHFDMYARAIRDAINEGDIDSAGIYGSLNFRDSADPADYPWHSSKFDNHFHRWQVWWGSIAPWVLRAGISEYWFDAASAPDSRRDAVLFSQWLAEHHAIRGCGEAFPKAKRWGAWRINRSIMNQMPWMATLPFMRSFDPNKRWVGLRLDYEAIVLIDPKQNAPDPTLAELVSFRRRGFTLASPSSLDALVQEAYAEVPDG